MEDPISHRGYARYSPSPSSSSPTEVGSPTSFYKSIPTPSTSDANDNNKMLLFTMFQLLQRIQAQVEGQESRLKGVESSMSLRTRYQESQPKDLRDHWGNVVEEYERSILNLRKSFAEEDEKHKVGENSEANARSGDSGHLGVGRDEDAYSVSVYSGNILERTLDQVHQEYPIPVSSERLQSIRYETDTRSNTGSPAQSPDEVPWEKPAKSPSRTISMRSHQYLEVATTILDAWKVFLISEYEIMKHDIRKSNTIQDSETTDDGREVSTNPRPPRPLYRLIGRTYCILEKGGTRFTMMAKKEWKIRKESGASTARRLGHFSKGNLKHAKQTLSAFKEGFVAY